MPKRSLKAVATALVAVAFFAFLAFLMAAPHLRAAPAAQDGPGIEMWAISDHGHRIAVWWTHDPEIEQYQLGYRQVQNDTFTYITIDPRPDDPDWQIYGLEPDTDYWVVMVGTTATSTKLSEQLTVRTLGPPVARQTDPTGEITEALYAVSIGTDSLYTISTADGSPTLIGATGITNPTGLAFDASGNLYTLGRNNRKLYTLNTADGSSTLVHATNTLPSLPSNGALMDLAWDPDRSKMYYAYATWGTGNSRDIYIYEIDITDGTRGSFVRSSGNNRGTGTPWAFMAYETTNDRLHYGYRWLNSDLTGYWRKFQMFYNTGDSSWDDLTCVSNCSLDSIFVNTSAQPNLTDDPAANRLYFVYNTGTTDSGRAFGTITTDIVPTFSVIGTGDINFQVDGMAYQIGNSAPIFGEASYSRNTAGNGVSGDNVGEPIPLATDAEGDTITYALSGTGASTFSIDSSGQITLTADPGSDGDSYTLTLTATDSKGASSTTEVSISVLSADATLAALSISPGTLSPAFASNTYEYTATAVYTVASVTVSATTSHTDATVTGTGEHTISQGTTHIDVVVTSASGTATQTYQIDITRDDPPVDATLSSLTVTQGTLSPEFHSGITQYTVDVEANVDTIAIVAEASDAGATVTGAGTYTLNQGENEIEVVVSPSSGDDVTYTITITRASPSGTASLESMTISQGLLSPVFAPDIFNYTASVVHAVERITITAVTEDADAVVTGDHSHVLEEGRNTIEVIVTAPDEVTTLTYTIVVIRVGTPTFDAEFPTPVPNEGRDTATNFMVSILRTIGMEEYTTTDSEGNEVTIDPAEERAVMAGYMVGGFAAAVVFALVYFVSAGNIMLGTSLAVLVWSGLCPIFFDFHEAVAYGPLMIILAFGVMAIVKRSG